MPFSKYHPPLSRRLLGVFLNAMSVETARNSQKQV